MESSHSAHSRHYDYLVHSAEKIFGFTVDQTTHQRWYDLVQLTKVLDKRLDNSSPADSPEAYKQILYDTLNHSIETQYPSLSPEEDSAMYSRLLAIAEAICDVNYYAHTTPSPSEHMALRQVEGNLYAQLVLACCTERVTSQAGFQDFAKDFIILGEAGNMVDTSIDAGHDFRKGEIIAPYTVADRIRILRRTARLARELSPQTFSLRSLRAIGGVGLKVVLESGKT